MNNVILVDENDNPIGEMEKLEAHEKGLLHRAFSVMFVRKNNENKYEVLLQKRADNKYHCGGLWSNTCCSHPLNNETALDSAIRRIPEELGINHNLINKIKLINIGSFVYKANLDNNLIEHEFDHVILGLINSNDSDFNKEAITNYLIPNEISEVKWVLLDTLQKDLETNPQIYTPWLNQVLNITDKAIQEINSSSDFILEHN